MISQANANIDARLYRPPRIESYEVGSHTLYRVADLQPVEITNEQGRAIRSLEASIQPADYPAPEHNRQRLVVACGMGVDSIAMLVLMFLRGIVPDMITWADTGSEHEHTYRYLAVLQRWLRAVGFPPLCIVRRRCPDAGHRGLAEQLWKNEQIASPAYHVNHSCSVSWKLEPQRAYQRQLPWLWNVEATPLQALGFEADEEGTRSTGAVKEAIGMEAGESGRKSVRYAVDNSTDYEQWYPLIDWGMTRQDCVDAIEESPLPQPGKSACIFCPVAKQCELKAMADNEPEALGFALALEQRFLDGPNNLANKTAEEVAAIEAKAEQRRKERAAKKDAQRAAAGLPPIKRRPRKAKKLTSPKGNRMGKGTWADWIQDEDDGRSFVGLVADPNLPQLDLGEKTQKMLWAA